MIGYALLTLALCGIAYWLHRTFAISLQQPMTKVEQLRALLQQQKESWPRE